MQDKAPLGLRETKKLATRKELTRAARELVLEHGFDTMTVEMIAAAAQVSIRTFFNYFDSKETAVLGAPSEFGTPESRSEFLAGRPTGDLLTDLLHVISRSDGNDIPERAELHMLQRIMDAEPRLMATQLGRFVEWESAAATLLIERMQADEAIGDDPVGQARMIAAIAFTILRQAGQDWFHSEDPTSRTEPPRADDLSGRDLQHDLQHYIARSSVLAARVFTHPTSTPG